MGPSTPSPSSHRVKREASPIDVEEYTAKRSKAKPEAKSNDESTPKKQTTKNPARPWTGEELDVLLTIAVDGGGASRANYEGRIPGRSGFQCNQTWR